MDKQREKALPFLEIVRPVRGELEGILEFFEKMLRDTFESNGIIHLPDLLEEEIEDKKRYILQDFSSQGEERYFLLAKSKGKILGTIEYGRANALLKACTDGALAEILEIGTLFVDPEYQGLGISKVLQVHLFRRLQNKGISKVCFDSGYPIAQGIWRKRFGEPEYFLENYWGPGSHHMVWQVGIDDFLYREGVSDESQLEK